MEHQGCKLDWKAKLHPRKKWQTTSTTHSYIHDVVRNSTQFDCNKMGIESWSGQKQKSLRKTESSHFLLFLICMFIVKILKHNVEKKQNTKKKDCYI